MMKPLLSVREQLSAVALVAAMSCATVAQAQTVDGTRDALYPAALAVQVEATTVAVDASGLTAGVYTLHVQAGSATPIAKRVVLE